MGELEALGLRSSTYILLTSDNGYHEGVHRMGEEGLTGRWPSTGREGPELRRRSHGLEDLRL